MAGTRNYRELIVWQKAMDLADAVYTMTEGWPKHELYGLTSQIRRAAVSVPSNIAEGHGNDTPPAFLRFLRMSYGSLLEVETQALLAGRRGYAKESQVNSILEGAGEVGRLLNGLKRSIERRQSENG